MTEFNFNSYDNSKQTIIIDGVNVSGCDFLAKEDDYCSYSGEYRAYKGQCGCSDEEMCKDHPNCFYKKALKQLKRKEQECERLKRKLNPKLKNAHCTYFEGQTGLCKAKEFTRCNPVGCKLYTIDELSTIVDLQEQLDQLKEKNEELKTCYKNNLEVLRHEEKVNNNLTDRCMKAEQALQEIRQVVEFAMEEVLTIGQRNATAKILEILQKCEEVE